MAHKKEHEAKHEGLKHKHEGHKGMHGAKGGKGFAAGPGVKLKAIAHK